MVEDESDRNGGMQMTVQETVALYYDAWQNRRGDLSAVPLAEDFEFTGPVASFENAEGYRAMAREAGQAVTSFQVRRQFLDGNTVCSIIDWEMAMPGVGRMTSAELLDVEDGRIVRGELIYDAEALRRAMAQSGA
jgi:ketosteroid isomerase-like protein